MNDNNQMKAAKMKASLKMKPADVEAAHVQFGIELETFIPASAGIAVGTYHHGGPVTSGIDAATGERIEAPSFNGNTWRAERDASIRTPVGFQPCEFVSPILQGEAGLAALVKMVEFLNRIGAKVNDSCGCHVTVGIRSVIGTSEHKAVATFVNKLTALANQNAWAIYAQTGTDRHQNHYSHPLGADVASLINQIEITRDNLTAANLAEQCGRGMVNLRKAFLGDRGAIEFRAFAGTLNLQKIMHHIGTALGIMRRAHVAKVHPDFNHKAAKNATHALRRMWRLLGWTSYRRATVAFGLFGNLHAEFASYSTAALRMAQKFESKFPNANL